MSLTIHDIPIEIFLDQLLPIVDIPSLLSLACTDRFFAQLCSDDTLWKRRLREDMNFSINDARNKGFKLLYRGVRRPNVYVWGASDQGRLGMTVPQQFKTELDDGIPQPVQLPMKGTRIVSIVAGGWSFAALDEDGRLHVWGRLHAEAARNNYNDVGESSHQQNVPLILELPVRLVSVSAGRQFLVSLDSYSRVWLFTSWGRPALMHSHHPALSYPSLASPPQAPSSSSSRVIQVEAGWSLIALLTSTGSVLVEFPFHAPLDDTLSGHLETMSLDAEESKKTRITDPNPDALRVTEWEVDTDVLELPSLPEDLPTLRNGVALTPAEAASAATEDAYTNNTDTDELKIVKIAAGDNFVVALTNRGHVLKMNITPEEAENRGQIQVEFRRGLKKWEYLPEFSELEPIKAAFEAQGTSTAPASINITHISAQFQTFAAYSVGSSSIVLLGNKETTSAESAPAPPPESPSPSSSAPKIIPGLQNRNIVSVVLGDYHFAALTEDGHMLTWGKYSKGALGLGDPYSLPPGSPGAFVTAQERPPAAPEARQMGPGAFQIPLLRVRQHMPRGGRIPPEVEQPTEVKFDWQDGKKNKFVFGIAASGWHTAALVIDMEPNQPAASTAVSASDSVDASSSSSHQTQSADTLVLPHPDQPHSDHHYDTLPTEEERDAAGGPQMPGTFYPRTSIATGRGRGPIGANPAAPTETNHPIRSPFVPRVGLAGARRARGVGGRGGLRGPIAGMVPGSWQHQQHSDTEQDAEHEQEHNPAPHESATSFTAENGVEVSSGDASTVIHRTSYPPPDTGDEGSQRMPGDLLRSNLRGIRIGYAGRGAYRGRGFGRSLVEAREERGDKEEVDEGEHEGPLRERGGGPEGVDTTSEAPPAEPEGDVVSPSEPEPAEEAEAGQSSVPRGLRGVRIGFAGRGAYRGEGFGRVLAGGYRGLPRGRGGNSGSTAPESDASGTS